jgi:RecA/RadA recombinase
MAKKEAKAANTKLFSFSDITDLTDGLIKKSAIQREDPSKEVKRNFIGTGIYVLNAAFSGDIYGGISTNRISVLFGDSGVGKSFLCYNICRVAQSQGYSIIYIDTEFSIEIDQLPNYSIDTDPDKFMLLRNNVVEDLKIYITQLLDKLKEIKQGGKDIGKFMIVLDSVGQLASRKEVNDATDGKEKADFTKAKALASFFRIINSDLGYLEIPLVCTNHAYDPMEMYAQPVMKGGKGLFYTASSIAYLSKAKLKQEDQMDDLDLGQSGIVVTAKFMKNRLAKPKKVKFEISFVSGCNPYVGLDFWLEPENFEAVGICKGKMEDNKFKPGGNRWYVRHLGKHVPGSELFTAKVFTKEVLDSLRVIIKDYFRYKSVTEIDEVNRRLEISKGMIEDEDLYAENLDSDALFNNSDED